MYKLSRVMLIGAAALLVYSNVVLCLIGGWPGWIVLGLLLGVAFKRKGRILSAMGTACWASEEELRRAGMLGARHGLILGRLGAAGRNIFSRLRALLNGKLPDKEACEQFIARKEGELVRLPQAIHTSVFAPTGVGKGVSCVIPFLLTCDESCVVIDYKGELASLTAEARRRMGQEIVVLDPFKVVTQ